VAVTVTAQQGGATANGRRCRLLVLNNAASLQNGATAGAPTLQNTAITTTVTASRVYGAAVASPNGSYSPVAGTTEIDDVADGVNGEEYLTFRASAATGTPGTVTVGDGGSNSGGVALAEILPDGSGLPISEDSSGPPVASTTAALAVTSAAFIPPDGALLVALVASDGGGGTTSMTVSGGGVTWSPLVEQNPSGQDYAGVWVAQAPPPGDPVITAASAGGANGILLRIKVLTGAAAAQTGATLSAASAQHATITTTVTGSKVYGAAVATPNGTYTAEPLSTSVDSSADGVNSEQYLTFSATSATGTPGATLHGFTSSTAGGVALLEVLAAGTITEDASAPPVAVNTGGTSVSCSAFTPPAGALLVALVSSDGGAGVTTMTVSGGGLAWAQMVKANASGGDYAGVWIASASAPDPGPRLLPNHLIVELAAGMALRLEEDQPAAAAAAAAGTLDISGAAAGQAPATAAGSVSLGGLAAAAAPAAAAGAVTLAGTATAAGPGTTAAGALAITGAATAAAPVTAAGSITLTGASAAAAPVTAAGSLAIAGTATARAAVTAAGALAVAGTAAAQAPAAAAGLLTIAGTATASGPGTTAAGALTLAGTATAQASAAAGGTVTLAGSGAARAAAAAAGLLALTGTAAARAAATAAGSVTLAGTAAGTGPVTYGTARHAAMALPAAQAGDATTTGAHAVAGTMTIPRAQGGEFP